jgi:uncharacterized membrane protein
LSASADEAELAGDPGKQGDATMSTVLVTLSTWLHALATIVMIGHFVFAGLIYIPVLERRMQAEELRELLEGASARLRPLFGGSLLIFLVTGTHLMLINESYLGLGDFFANPWSVLIVIKHVLIVPFLALAVLSERAYLSQIGSRNARALKQFQRALNVNMVLGMVIVLLTMIAEAG